MSDPIGVRGSQTVEVAAVLALPWHVVEESGGRVAGIRSGCRSGGRCFWCGRSLLHRFRRHGGQGQAGRQRDQIYAWVGEQRGMENWSLRVSTAWHEPHVSPRPISPFRDATPSSYTTTRPQHNIVSDSPLRRVCPLYLSQASIVLMVYATIATSYTSCSSCNLPIRQPIRLRSSTRGQICPASIHADVNGSHN